MKTIENIVLVVLLVSATYAAEGVDGAVHGTTKKVDSTSKTILVKVADGKDHSMHVVDTRAVHGVDSSAAAEKDSWHGVKEGTDVVVHCAKKGTKDTALEIDKVAKAGLNASDGTIEDIDHGGKKLVVRSSDGVQSTYRLTNHAAEEVGKNTREGIEKGTKATVYYTKNGKEGSPPFREGLEQRTLNRCSHTSHSVAIERGRDRT